MENYKLFRKTFVNRVLTGAKFANLEEFVELNSSRKIKLLSKIFVKF